MFEMDPGNPMTRLFYLWVLALNGRADLVSPVLEAFPVDVRDTVPGRLAFFLAASMREPGTSAALPELSPEVEEAASAADVFARMLASGYAMAGETGLALRWLEVAVERGFINHPFLAHFDPSLASLRQAPRFMRLMEEVRGRWERFEPEAAERSRVVDGLSPDMRRR
jgi:hypothetical protein